AIGDDAFVQPEVFGGIARIDRGEACFKLLAIATGVERVAKVILPEDGQRGDGITEAVIGLAERFEAEKALRGGGEPLVAEIRNGPHTAEPHIGRPGDQTGDEDAIVGFLFDIPPKDMVKGVQKRAMPVDEMQHTPDVDLAESIE